MNWSDYFAYNAETGELSHKPRPREMFACNWAFLVWNKRFANKRAESMNNGYLAIRVYKKQYRANRVVYEMFNGPIPKGMVVDHIDRNPLNNKIENLRLATHSQNQMNRRRTRPDNKLGATGVIRTRRGKPYQAHITINSRSINLGRFGSLEEAVAVRDAAARAHHGEFAVPSINPDKTCTR